MSRSAPARRPSHPLPLPAVAATVALALLAGCAKPAIVPAAAPVLAASTAGDEAAPQAPAGLRAGGPPLPGGPALGRLLLDPIPLPDAGTASALRVSPAARRGDRRWPVAYFPLIEAGAGTGAVGLPINSAGAVMADRSRCVSLDYAAVVPAADGPLFISHLECHPGVILTRPVTFGVGVATGQGSPRPLDLSGAGGLGLPCAGSVTPWGTLLSSEEFETNAAVVLPDGTDPDNHAGWNRQVGYWVDGSAPQPYQYGWVPELGPFPAQAPGTGAWAVPAQKRTAMGRVSHEQALLMPDGRTVYLSDDGDNGVLTMFVADRAGDLRAGQLYAARIEDLPNTPGQPAGRVTWVPLGHATQDQIDAAIASRPAFSDLLRRAEVNGPGGCPSGLRPIHTAWGPECIGVQPNQETIASRLETRRVAALRGATTELKKAEGLAVDAVRQRVLLSITSITAGMEAAHPKWDRAGPDHIRLTPNRCGGVLSFEVAAGQRDDSGAPIDSAWAANTVGWLLQGKPAQTGCDLDQIAGPDNINVWPEADLLFIAEDTREHPNANVWAYDLRTGALHRVATAPPHSELAGLQLSVDPLGQTWLSLSVQFDRDADGTSQSGLLGPLTPPVTAP